MQVYKHIDFCLLIPCYNNLEGLCISLESVEYTGGHYLIVIVDDGSSELLQAEKINKSLSREKPLVILTNKNNLGITTSLNNGLSWIEENTDAEFIARLDCGDTCTTDRFDKQVRFMRTNPQIVLTGTWCLFENRETGERYSYKTPLIHSNIIRAMHFRNVFIHPTVMFRKEMLKITGYYPLQFDYAEDYAFFWNMINQGETAIINEFLVTTEISETGLSYKNRGKQLVARARVTRVFGKSIVLEFAAYMRLLLLFILPKQITLQLKKWRR